MCEKNPTTKKSSGFHAIYSEEEEARLIQEAREQYLLDQKLRMAAMRRKGIAEGIEKGMEKGIEKGIEIGAKKAAINLIAMGFDDTMVSKVTGLPPENTPKLRTK